MLQDSITPGIPEVESIIKDAYSLPSNRSFDSTSVEISSTMSSDIDIAENGGRRSRLLNPFRSFKKKSDKVNLYLPPAIFVLDARFKYNC